MVPPCQGFDERCGILTQGGVPRLCRITCRWAVESSPFGPPAVCLGEAVWGWEFNVSRPVL